MIIEGVIFDFNGTMFFDEEFQEKAWRYYLESKIGREVTHNEFQEYIHGRNAEVTLSYFLKRELTRQEVADLEEEKEVFYRQLCLGNPDKFKLAEGLPEFLDELKKRNIPMTIATASAKNNVEFFFEHLQLGKWFDYNKVVFNDGSFPGKPEPDIFLMAAENIGVAADKCGIFEDTTSGLKAAYRAGAAKVICVASMLDDKTIMSLDGVSGTIKNYKNMEELFEMI